MEAGQYIYKKEVDWSLRKKESYAKNQAKIK